VGVFRPETKISKIAIEILNVLIDSVGKTIRILNKKDKTHNVDNYLNYRF
jgi:hypothetical protein